MNTSPKAVVFDCDGVLVDSEKAWFVGIVNVFTRRGIHRLVTGPASSLYGASVSDVVSMLEREVGEPLDREAVAREVYDAILAAIDVGVVAMEGAVELLETLRGSRPLAVASNGSRETTEASMRAASIPFVFDAIVAYEPPLRPKPAPDLYLRACELLEVRPAEAIAVEDSLPERSQPMPQGSSSSASAQRRASRTWPRRSCRACSTPGCSACSSSRALASNGPERVPGPQRASLASRVRNRSRMSSRSLARS